MSNLYYIIVYITLYKKFSLLILSTTLYITQVLNLFSILKYNELI